MIEPNRPSTQESLLIDKLGFDPEHAGIGFGSVRQVELTTRTAWLELVNCWPGTSGTRNRLHVLTKQFARAVDGPHSRLGRAIAQQELPWDLEREPLRSAIGHCQRLVDTADSLGLIIVQTAKLNELYTELEKRFAPIVPQAWQDLATSRGLSTETISAINSPEEVAAFTYRLDRLQELLGEWTSSLQEWIDATVSSYYTADEHQVGRAEPAAPTAALERRYELLLRLGAIDRQPLQQRTAIALRQTAERHGRAIAASRRLDEVERIVSALEPESSEPMISGDELCKYIEVLRLLHRNND